MKAINWEQRRYELARAAMQGHASNTSWINSMRVPDDWDDYMQRLAKGSVELADEMIKQLKVII